MGELEGIPNRELMDWMHYDKLKASGGPKQTPAMMFAEAKRITMMNKLSRRR